MNISARAFRWTAQISLLVTLTGLSAYLTVHNYLGDAERVFREGAVTEVDGHGPVEIGKIRWQLDSLQPYTRLIDKEKKEIEFDHPAGSVIILVKVSVTPLDGLKMDDGFTCEAKLRDDRGNVWEDTSVFGLDLATYCGDDDRPIERNQTGQIAQVYVVPASAVPHLIGIQVEDADSDVLRRILLTW
ncbi:hypothetical protein F1D05_20635 [Kribbella qitaiheensis]|uniref:DUF4352 domain-containing protein n=1 Tax=Kribbella qitaiheensis TaxID=1544730 RepID=A0A7G6X0W1_9ACTN|nr:hypothetical protein [Kribbella qitaiheensis]QNE19876.1 hypothetical protein F1D05_20635 [Kribbella qitaiheensis]